MNNVALLLALADGPPVEFATTALTGVGVTAIVKPAALEIGDLVLVWSNDISATATLDTTTGSTWGRHVVFHALAGPNNNSSLFWKVMTATDLAQAWTLSAAPTSFSQAVRYRGHGATTVTSKDAHPNGSGSTTVTLTGFTKAAGSYGVVSVYIEENTGGTPPVAPAGWTERMRTALSGFTAIIADKLYEYVDGAAVVWTVSVPSVNAQSAILLEVTGP